jgi:hypothetical protein
MNPLALIFMLAVWTFVLGLTGWSFHRLMKTDPANEKVPSPGSIP